jgi:hypothetical protein
VTDAARSHDKKHHEFIRPARQLDCTARRDTSTSRRSEYQRCLEKHMAYRSPPWRADPSRLVCHLRKHENVLQQHINVYQKIEPSYVEPTLSNVSIEQGFVSK